MQHEGSALNFLIKVHFIPTTRPIIILLDKLFEHWSMHRKINAENTNSKTEKNAVRVVRPTFTLWQPSPSRMWQPAPWRHCMKIIIFRLCHLCDGLLYRITVIALFLLNLIHRTIHINLKQNYRYIISNSNYKYYSSHAKSDIYRQKSNYSVRS